jgi:hypothetical protein
MAISRTQQYLRNGDNGHSRLPSRRFSAGNTPPDDSEEPGFSAADTRRLGCEQRMMLSLIAVGLGTTGALVVNALATKVQFERNRRSLPGTFDYLLVDAAAAQPGMDGTNFHQIPGGIDGSGTDPHEGHRLFFDQANYQQLRSTLNNRVMGLLAGDPEVPTQSPRQAMDFLLVAGNGGTSGGGLYRAIGVLHDVAQDRHIEQPRINVVFIGAEMSLRDKNRQVTLEQQCIVRATAACNLRKLLADMATDGYLQEARPDGTTFPVKASERVWSLTVADQSNGFSDHATIAELGHMLTEALYLRFFTPAGAFLAERLCDLRKLGVMGLGKA